MLSVRARPDRLPDTELAAIQAQLELFAGGIAGVRNAVVASIDGFALAQVSDHSGSSERLAAMTSSMLALAKAVSRELLLGDLEVLMMEAADGKVLMLSIPAPGRPLLLMAACTQRSVIGNVLWSARQCSQNILDALSER